MRWIRRKANNRVRCSTMQMQMQMQMHAAGSRVSEQTTRIPFCLHSHSAFDCPRCGPADNRRPISALLLPTATALGDGTATRSCSLVSSGQLRPAPAPAQQREGREDRNEPASQRRPIDLAPAAAGFTLASFFFIIHLRSPRPASRFRARPLIRPSFVLAAASSRQERGRFCVTHPRPTTTTTTRSRQSIHLGTRPPCDFRLPWP